MITPATPLEPEPQPDPDARPARVKRTIERSGDVAEEDAYAPAPSGCVCRSRSGYMRRAHTVDADGRCVFCDVVPLAAVRPAASFRRR